MVGEYQICDSKAEYHGHDSICNMLLALPNNIITLKDWINTAFENQCGTRQVTNQSKVSQSQGDVIPDKADHSWKLTKHMMSWKRTLSLNFAAPLQERNLCHVTLSANKRYCIQAS